MRCRVTEKEIRNSFADVVRVGYCRLQTLLMCESPFAYTCGYNGWKADFYDCGVTCISTGYAPIGKSVPYEIIKKYERKAEKNYNAFHSGKVKKWETLKRRNYKLICEMLAEVDAL